MSRQSQLLAVLGLLVLSLSTLPTHAQSVSCSNASPWVATTTYPVGARVTLSGSLYEALVSGANIPPNYCPACGWWKLIGTCGPGGGDTTAPSVPMGLRSTAKTSSSVSLSWNASSDNIGVAGYDVLRGGTVVGSPTGTSFTVTGLASNTSFSFTVRARDAAGNASAQSTMVSVTTSPGGNDTAPPSVPMNLTSPSKSSSSVSLSWTASSDNVGVAGYDVFRGGTVVGSPTGTSFTVTGLAANTQFSFTVRARDASGNVSGQSGAISVRTDQVVVGGGMRFCPYIDVSPGASSPIMQLANNGSGAKCYSLAFILGRGCDPSWFGVFPIGSPEGDALGQRIQELKNAGGNVIISFGGAAAPELANACTNVNSLRAAYQGVINKYHPMAIDLDIEDFDPFAIDRRNAALAGVSGAAIHYTLGVLEDGMTQAQISVLTNAKSHNVNVSMVNIMAMDYGHPVSNMFNAAVTAANGTRSQMSAAGYGSAQLGITVMIGQNDSGGEIFSLANAQSLRSNAAGASMLSFWSLGRDNGGCPGGGAASPSCSGISQGPFAFSNILKSF